MKKTLLLLCLIFMAGISTFAQTIVNPAVERSDDDNCFITKIETTDKHTIVSFEYIAQGDSAWAEINKEIYIKTDLSDKHYAFVKAENITIAPEKHYLANDGDKLAFKVYFQKIPKNAKSIDVIENAEASNFFNYYGVSLSKSQGKVVRMTLTPPPVDKALRGGLAGGNMMQVFDSMAPMISNMAKSMMDAQLEYYKQPGKLTEIAKLNKAYFDALVKEGFTYDQALKIITSESLLPKATMSGK
jgi:hypothetical protein